MRALRSPLIIVMAITTMLGAGATMAWAERPEPAPPPPPPFPLPEYEPPTAELIPLQGHQGPCFTPDEVMACPPSSPEPAAHADPTKLMSYIPIPKGDFIPVVERWRRLVARYFEPEDVDRALRVIMCESTGDPLAKNRRSSASGLFQHLRRYWTLRAAEVGLGAASIFDPEANIAAAAWLVYEGGGWSHWRTSRRCWR
ncbi:MAG TPA: transglycosylase SLT domain-containing protein [Acidimicrobiia bacterium]